MAFTFSQKPTVTVSYNSSTKRVEVVGSSIIYGSYSAPTATECTVPKENIRGRLKIGFGNDSLDCESLKMIASQTRNFVTSELNFQQSIGFSIDAKIYNEYFRSTNVLYRAYQYDVTDPLIVSRWKIYTEKALDCYGFCGTITTSAAYQVCDTNTASLPPLKPAIPTFTLTESCGTQIVITITNPTIPNVDYFSIRKSSTLNGTYTEVAKLYSSGGTFTYTDTTKVPGFFKVYSVNNLYINDVYSDIKEAKLSPVIVGNVVYTAYPSLAYSAKTTNYCAGVGVDSVYWYLNGILTGTTSGNATFNGTLPTDGDEYTLTAKFHYTGGTLSNASNSLILIFYRQTILSGFTSNGTMVIPNGYSYMKYLIVGGGASGAGGSSGSGYQNQIWGCGGGGGAGGYLSGTILNPTGGTYNVVIGNGGGGNGSASNNGGDSSFYNMTAKGGGGGGQGVSIGYTYVCAAGKSGGSGGGGGAEKHVGGGCAGSGGAATTGQGKNGASGSYGAHYGGGGGGAGSAGSGKSGGAGVTNNISGSLVTYCTGGSGRDTVGNGANATNYGGGGGGGSAGNPNGSPEYGWSGAGKQGIVYVKLYNIYPYLPIAASNLNATDNTCSTLELNWTNNNVGQTGVTGNHIQKLVGATWTTIGTVGANVTNYLVQSLSPNTNYEFRIVTYNDTYQIPSNSLIASTLNPKPINLNVTLNTYAPIVDWDLLCSDYGTSIMPEIRVSGTTTWLSGTTLPANATSYSFVFLESNTTYEVQIVRNDFTSDILVFTTGTIMPQEYFITVWDTTKLSENSSNNNQVKLPLISGGTYNFLVNWGDGNTSTITAYNQAQVTHTYASSGVHTIIIYGTCIGWNFYQQYWGDRLKLLEIIQWGTDFNWGNHAFAFYACSNLNVTAVDSPNLNGITTLAGLFAGCNKLTYNSTINNWDISNITSLYSTFGDCYIFNQSLSNWNTSNVTNMIETFAQCTLYNQSLNSWDTSKVTSMQSMFNYCPSYNQPMNNWNTSNVTDMSEMFFGDTMFNQDLSSWDTSKVTAMYRMFKNCPAYNQPMNTWDISSVIYLHEMFQNSPAYNQPMNNWNTSNVQYMHYMFENCVNFNQDISSWDVSNVVDGTGFLTNGELSKTNYDALLLAWKLLPLQSNVTFDFGNSKYCMVRARKYIINTFNWTLIDGGVADDCLPFELRNCWNMGGIKNVWIAPWTEYIDYIYWNQDDYFQTIEDKLYESTSIKDIFLSTGGTIQWYSLPIAPQLVNLSQNLSIVREGFVLNDLLNIAISKADASKWTKTATLINPDNKWIYVIYDDNGLYWVGGLKNGAKIDVYNFNTGNRGEDNGYGLTFSDVSGSSLLTTIDENYVKTNVK